MLLVRPEFNYYNKPNYLLWKRPTTVNLIYLIHYCVDIKMGKNTEIALDPIKLPDSTKVF